MSATPKNEDRGELVRIVASMTATMVISGVILGAVFLGTDRYKKVADLAAERRDVFQLLALDSTASVTEVSQFLSEASREVVYHARPFGQEEAERREVRFTLAGEPRGDTQVSAAQAALAEKGMRGLGRVFVARRGATLAGFVIEGQTRGYKNRIRFFIALDSAFTVQGVRVREHEEDPGLGAEVATPWFQGQFIGRTATALSGLDVTKDPMPEDWRSALQGLARTPIATWRSTNGALVEREGAKPIYAVTGATISSRALTNGVRTTVDHFRRRWSLLAPYLGGPA